MQKLQARETYQAQRVVDGQPVWKKIRNADGNLVKRLDAEGDPIPDTERAYRWHDIGLVSKDSDKATHYLVSPIDDDAVAFHRAIDAWWPNVMRESDSPASPFRVQVNSVVHSADLRITLHE